MTTILRKYFGTDGIRGRVGDFPITADFMLKLGWAIGTVLTDGESKKVIIGKDTRISGYLIESALQAGLEAAGVYVILLGPMPTSAIAYLTQTLNANIGIVISASHNPYDDNGIKLFNRKGLRLSNSIESEIESALAKPIKTGDSKSIGRAKRIDDAAGRYIEYCKSAIPHHTYFNNFKVVVDCANGATYHIAPHVFSELGAHVTAINTSPNGFNINLDCGSTHPEVIKSHTIKAQADVGIAFDGDGDRVILIDHQGEILDGDEMLYIIAKGLKLYENYAGGVVGTCMTNTGLEIALKDLGLKFIRTSVGGQYVLEELLKHNWLLGGEPSGHIIFLRTNTTDDGIIAALLVMKTMEITGKTLHELKQGLTKLPQQVNNIPYRNKIDLESKDILLAVQTSKKKLGKHSRILMRYSGTESLIRIMVEGENELSVNNVNHSLSELIRKKVTD